MRIKYKPPSGPEVKNPTKSLIRDLILHEGEAYWKRGGGSGVLVAVDDQDNENHLSLTLYEPYGFDVNFMHEPTAHERFAVVSSLDFSEKVTITDFAGGGDMTVPRAALISRADAWKAAEDFLDTGERSRMLKWVEMGDLV